MSQDPFHHSSLFGSNLNFQLEQLLHLQSQQEGRSQNFLNTPPLPHQANPLPSQQYPKYSRRMEMY